MNGKIETKEELIKEMAQTIINLATMMMPVSGLSMMALVSLAKSAEKYTGEVKIEPDQAFMEGFANYQNKLLHPYLGRIEQANEVIVEANKVIADLPVYGENEKARKLCSDYVTNYSLNKKVDVAEVQA